MTRRIPPPDLPDWPRLMRADLAAAYVGVGRETFESEVAMGVWPQPKERKVLGTRPIRTWDRDALDAAVDRMGTPGKPSGLKLGEAAKTAWGKSP